MDKHSDPDWWRFEPVTYLMEAMEAHYDHPGGLPGDRYHADTEVCAKYMIEWLEYVGVRLEKVSPVQGEV